jgi:hypothetical protein
MRTPTALFASTRPNELVSPISPRTTVTTSPTSSTTDLAKGSAFEPPRSVMKSPQLLSCCCTSNLIPHGPALRLPASA